MPDAPKEAANTEEKLPVEPKEAIPISPQEAAAAIQKLTEAPGVPQALQTLFAGFFRSTTIGPDPETAKQMAQVEMHAETTRLEGYRGALQNKDRQNQRDHEYRLKRLNRDTILMGGTVLVGAAGAITGLWLIVTGQTALGSNVLIGGVGLMIYALGGRIPSIKGSE